MIYDILIASLFCVGIETLLSPGFPLHFIREWYMELENKILITILNPVIGCSICFASVWGTIVYLFLREFNAIEWILFVICVAGLNYLLSYLYDV